jgi:hypothetical protein
MKLNFEFVFAFPGGPQGTYVYSSFRNRNFWLEYSTPPTTLFPEYDEYNPEPSATPEPGPIFRDAALNHSTLQAPVGSTVFLDCRIADLMDYQVCLFVCSSFFVCFFSFFLSSFLSFFLLLCLTYPLNLLKGQNKD